MIKTISREFFIPSPAPGTAVHAQSYYTARAGRSLMSLHAFEARDDILDVAYRRFSDDHGRTWSEPEIWPTRFAHPDGTGRRYPSGAYVDPATGRLIFLWIEGVLPNDQPLEGLWRWTLHYSVAAEGECTPCFQGQIIHQGAEYDAIHHMPGITVGKNCLMIGDRGQRPLTSSDGVILVPVQSSPVGPDGKYFNPGGGYTYTDCLLLFGRWRADGALDWTASERVRGDPARTTCGLIEPTIAELADGRILMVMRGSNDARPELPGYRWHALSEDGGMTWSIPAPWTYTDGEPFFSPSSCSQLIPFRDGRLFWMGNICATHPRGDNPRYPLVLCEVDRSTGAVIRGSVSVIDDRQPDESPHLTLSNFFVREDREADGLTLHLTRLYAHDTRLGGKVDFTADALVYAIGIAP